MQTTAALVAGKCLLLLVSSRDVTRNVLCFWSRGNPTYLKSFAPLMIFATSPFSNPL